MSDKISMTTDDLKKWAAIAMTNGTERAAFEMYDQWCSGAEKELDRLRTKNAALRELVREAFEARTGLLTDWDERAEKELGDGPV